MIKSIWQKVSGHLSSFLVGETMVGGSAPFGELDLSLNKLMVNPRGLSRKQKMLSFIFPATQEGLEIGPLCWPLVTKSESNGQICYVDYSTAEFLREKYGKNSKVIVDEIVETDYLWGNQTLPELVQGKLFDYVIASHVFEHVPNILGWLKEIAEVLKDNGVLSLAIPDKRYTFDIKRPLTSVGDIIESYLLNKRRPSPRDIFDHTSLACKVDMVLAWNNGINENDLEHMGNLEKAYLLASKYLSTEDYQDVHVNILTPARFLELIETASELDLFDYEIASFHDTFYNSHEFIVSLRRLSREFSGNQKIIRQLSNIASVRKQLVTSGVNILVAISPNEIPYRLGVSRYVLACSMMNVGSSAGCNLKINVRCNNDINAKIKIQETHPQTGKIMGGDLIAQVGIGESRTFLLSVNFTKSINQSVSITVDVVDDLGMTVGFAEIPVLPVEI